MQGYLAAMSVEMLFDSLAVRLRAEDVGGLSATVNWTFTDVGEQWVLGLEHRALHAIPGRHDTDADATVTTTRAALVRLVTGEISADAALSSDDVTIDGDADALGRIFGHLDTFLSNAPIVEP